MAKLGEKEYPLHIIENLGSVPDEETHKGQLNSGESFQIMDVNNPLIIEEIQFGGNSAQLDIKIERYKEDGITLVPFTHLSKDGSVINDFYRIENMFEDSNEVATNVSSIFIIELYESNKANYKISIKDGLEIACPNGVKITITNSAGQAQNVGCVISYRECTTC